MAHKTASVKATAAKQAIVLILDTDRMIWTTFFITDGSATALAPVSAIKNEILAPHNYDSLVPYQLGSVMPTVYVNVSAHLWTILELVGVRLGLV